MMDSYLLCAFLLVSAVAAGEVRMSEEKIMLPTYEAEPPGRIPLFFRHEEVQLAEKHVYPYPFYDVKSTEKVDREYTAVILENEYLKICVTPEMGGRLYYAIDKTNGYDIVYNNRVVKPALIGTIGAWTSGGVEWNTPHHHRPTSLIDVDYTLCENPDGSKTVWVGEYEKRSRTRWLTGMTLEPGKAYLRISVRSMNVTPYQYPALWFANTAVHVNDTYQIIFPPDVEMVNFHYVSEFARWPVLNQVYQSEEYTHGEDLSWWKETRSPTSFFVTETRQDFMGGIDHGRDAGIVMIGDHHIFKGKKLWNWGRNEVQEAWDRKLTDEDGPYAELMMGFYSDNQPDYNFLAPFETKYGDMYLYGIRNLSGIKEANRDFAVNLEVKDGEAIIEVNATSAQRAAIRLTRDESVLVEEQADVSPAASWRKTAAVPEGTGLTDLSISVLPEGDAEPVVWRKAPDRNAPFPETYQDPRDPSEYETAQDLFFAGLRLEQFGNTNYGFMNYYEAALDKDPDHFLTNTQLGQVWLKRKEYARAEEHLRRAVAVVTGNHKKAEDATPLYYLGLCLAEQDRIEEALDMLYRATWACEWTSAGYTLIARLEGCRGDWRRAAGAAERAYHANMKNVEAMLVYTIALRMEGRYEEALAMAEAALDADPLRFTAMNEKRILGAHISAAGDPESNRKTLEECLRDEPYNYIEMAARYSRCGLYGEAAAVIRMAAESEKPALNTYPMVYYHLGYYLDRAGRPEAAEKALEKAAALSTERCFPYGTESIRVLEFATAENAADASAWYLLGNALADYRREKAVDCWRKAAELRPDRAIIYRNIAYLQANHLHEMPDALDNIMKAISLDPSEPRYFSEANLYMSYASLTPEELSQFLAEYGDMGSDITDIQLMAIRLDIFQGDFDHAIELLNAMEYHIEEGARFNPHVYWFDAHLHKGIEGMAQGEHAEAEALLSRAMEFPENLEAERDGKIGIAWYYRGLNAKAAGDEEQAREYFEKMVDYTYSKTWFAGDFPELDYFRAKAAVELGGDPEEAEAQFRKLIDQAEDQFETRQDGRHITVSVAETHSARIFLLENELEMKQRRVSSYYMQGLGWLGRDDRNKARAFFEKALEADPLAIDPKYMLKYMEQAVF
jgi:tetratricopeptide (TPR) repeat protein